jgi:DNA-binding PadR family transcriptional regulator
MRHEAGKGGIKFAILGMIARGGADGHYGYALRRRLKEEYPFWQVNCGEVYRYLDDLLKEGLIEPLADRSGPRRPFRITQKGTKTLGDFVVAPPTDAPRPLRQELAVKLLFASPEQLPVILRLIGSQQCIYMEELNRLNIARRKQRRRGDTAPPAEKERIAQEAFFVELLIGYAERQVRVDLDWLDHVALKLKERFAH